MLVIEPQGKRTKKIIITSRFLQKPDLEREKMVAEHLARWGFFDEEGD
jgi:hypothetical protein